MTRFVFRIHDGGEHWDYSEVSREAAMHEHLRLNYDEAGIEYPPEGDIECSRLPDEKVIKIGDCDMPDGKTGEITKTAREWADAEEGLIGTTCV